jgi:hypothetical protein
VGFFRGHKLPLAAAELNLKKSSKSVRPAVRNVHAVGWVDRREDFAVVGRYLHRNEPTFAAAYDVEGDAHSLGERLCIMARFLLSHYSVLDHQLLSRYGATGRRLPIYALPAPALMCH